MLGHSKSTFYEVASNSSHSTILLLKNNFYLHICIVECNLLPTNLNKFSVQIETRLNMIDSVFLSVILHLSITLGSNHVVSWLKLVLNGRMTCAMSVAISLLSTLAAWVSWSAASGCADPGSIVHSLSNMDAMASKRSWNPKDNAALRSLFNSFNPAKSLPFISQNYSPISESLNRKIGLIGFLNIIQAKQISIELWRNPALTYFITCIS